MKARHHIQFELVKLVDGDRLLRLTDTPSGLSLEKKLGRKDALLLQKQRLLQAFEAVLNNHELVRS